MLWVESQHELKNKSNPDTTVYLHLLPDCGHDVTGYLPFPPSRLCFHNRLHPFRPQAEVNLFSLKVLLFRYLIIAIEK